MLIMSAMKAEAEDMDMEMQAEFSQQKDETRDKVCAFSPS